MKTQKLIIAYCLTAISTLAYSPSYAQQNDGTVFFSGRAGATDLITGCSGSCSADPNGTVELGFSGDHHDEGASYRLSSSLAYAHYQFNINGTALNVDEKGIILHAEVALQSLPSLVLDAKIEPTWKTASSLNSPDRTVFGVGSGIDLLYQVNPGFYAVVGWSIRTISPANLPDFRYSTMDAGFRWYFF